MCDWARGLRVCGLRDWARGLKIYCLRDSARGLSVCVIGPESEFIIRVIGGLED